MIVPTKPPAAVHDQRDDQPDDDRRVDTMARDSGRIVPPGGTHITRCGAGQPGLEPGTCGFGDRRYHQLSYCPLL